MAEQQRRSGTAADDRGPAMTSRDARVERTPERGTLEVRATDIEPYTGLRYLSTLFRFMAIIMIALLVAEVATGIYTQGAASLPTLLGEASRLIVLAGVLWGTGDLAHLLIDIGHDVRATRILGARVVHAMKIAPVSIVQTPSDRAVDAVRTSAMDSRLADRPGTRPLADHRDDEPPGPADR